MRSHILNDQLMFICYDTKLCFKICYQSQRGFHFLIFYLIFGIFIRVKFTRVAIKRLTLFRSYHKQQIEKQIFKLIQRAQ